ncbi:MAG: hypothetical protein P4L84_35060 [Isosphaeraceae bacterium]|nr:hypothetical protein [Isosphaeraceae bacterium]
MSDQPRCDRCKFFRPIAALYAKGDRVGECRPGAASFRGVAHQGEGFLQLWGHTRAHWECGAFVAAEGVQPFAERDQPDSDPDAREFPPADTSSAPPVDVTGPGAEPTPTVEQTPPAEADVTALPEPDNTPSQAEEQPNQAEEPTTTTPDQTVADPAIVPNTTDQADTSSAPAARPNRPVVKGNRR